MNIKFTTVCSTPPLILVSLGIAIWNAYRIYFGVRSSRLTRRLYLTSFLTQTTLLFLSFWNSLLNLDWLNTVVEQFHIITSTSVASCVAFGIIHAVWFRSQRLAPQWKIIGTVIIFANIAATLLLMIAGISGPVDMYEMAVLSAMCIILGISATEYPSAAMNIFFGYSVIVISLILRDRLAPRTFFVDNKDAYLFVCRVGYIFVAKGAILADQINREIRKPKKTVTFASNWR